MIQMLRFTTPVISLGLPAPNQTVYVAAADVQMIVEVITTDPKDNPTNIKSQVHVRRGTYQMIFDALEEHQVLVGDLTRD